MKVRLKEHISEAYPRNSGIIDIFMAGEQP